jgi:muramoyltetrapeptide carboxypeptidase
MDRRGILKAGIIGLALTAIPNKLITQTKNKLIKPKVLNQGDKVGIIAPATSVSDPSDIQKATQVLDYFNLKYKFGDYVFGGEGYKSRSVSQRIEDLHKMFSDEEIKAIFCLRGGYGSPQLLDKIDYNLIKKNPKIFLGYSDITAMHLAITKMSGIVTFHGPVMMSAFSNYTVEYFRRALFSTEPIGEISNPMVMNGIRVAYPYRTIYSGVAKGGLTGGNLSMICSLMGTPYEIETKGKILFIEDVGEEPFRIDRMLTQLNLSGKLSQANGIVFGRCNDCDKNSNVWDYSLNEVLDQQLKDLKIPVVYGLLIGHTAEQVTIPYEVEATLDADNGKLIINESACE